MARSGPRIVYRNNPPILGKRWEGRKTWDAITGFYTYESFITANDYGDLVDQRGEGMDYRGDTPTVIMAPGDLPTSTPENGSVPWYGMK